MKDWQNIKTKSKSCNVSVDLHSFHVTNKEWQKCASIWLQSISSFCKLESICILYFISCFVGCQRIHQSILNGTSTSTQSSSKNVLVTNPPVHFGFFLWTGQSTSPVQNTFWFLILDKWNVGIFNGFALYYCIEMFLKTNWDFKTGRKFEFN